MSCDYGRADIYTQKFFCFGFGFGIYTQTRYQIPKNLYTQTQYSYPKHQKFLGGGVKNGKFVTEAKGKGSTNPISKK